MSLGCSHLNQDEPPRPSVDHHAAGGAQPLAPLRTNRDKSTHWWQARLSGQSTLSRLTPLLILRIRRGLSLSLRHL